MNCSMKIFEKVNGVSDVETLECYSLLSQYYFFKRNLEVSEYYLMKMIHIATVSFGEEYP